MELNRLKQMVEQDFEFLRRLGLRLERLEPGRVILALPRAGNENHMDGIWAGALFTLAELPGGILVYSAVDESRFVPLVKEMTIRFVTPARSDVTIDLSLSPDEIRTLARQAEEDGYAEFTLVGEVRDRKGEVVVISTGQYRIQRLAVAP